MLVQFEISKGTKTPNCSRTIRSKTGDNKGKESKTNRSVEIRMFTILDLLLLHKSWVFNLVLVPTDGRLKKFLNGFKMHSETHYFDHLPVHANLPVHEVVRAMYCPNEYTGSVYPQWNLDVGMFL